MQPEFHLLLGFKMQLLFCLCYRYFGLCFVFCVVMEFVTNCSSCLNILLDFSDNCCCLFQSITNSCCFCFQLYITAGGLLIFIDCG